jgi:hypothetical protein
MKYRSLLVSLSVALAVSDGAAAEEQIAKLEPEAHAQKQVPETPQGDKALSGMSILGNQEAPKALVIVPWKGSEIGDTLGLNDNLDDSRRPVDKEVFLRELRYYELRSARE